MERKRVVIQCRTFNVMSAFQLNEPLNSDKYVTTQPKAHDKTKTQPKDVKEGRRSQLIIPKQSAASSRTI
jgi:hypothetical protein